MASPHGRPLQACVCKILKSSGIESQSWSLCFLAACGPLHSRQVDPAGLRAHKSKQILAPSPLFVTPAWRLKSHKSFREPRSRTNRVIPPPGAPAATSLTAEDVEPIGGVGPSTCGGPPRSGRGAARGDLLPGVALRGTESNGSLSVEWWVLGHWQGFWRSFWKHFWTCKPVPSHHVLHFSAWSGHPSCSRAPAFVGSVSCSCSTKWSGSPPFCSRFDL